MEYKYLGKRIRDRRKELRISQEKLAETVEVTTSYIGQIERAERKLSIETLIRISNALFVTVDFLLKDSILVENDEYIHRLNSLVFDKSDEAKATVIDVVQALLLHIE